MLKFHFVRMQEPHVHGPSWGVSSTADIGASADWRQSPAAAATYEWLCGRDALAEPAADLHPSEAVQTILEGDEEARVTAALRAGAAAAGGDSDELIAACLDWLRSAEGQETAEAIVAAGGVFGTAEREGAPRRAKACNPAGTNPADMDVTHALIAAGSASVPLMLEALRNDAEPWGVLASAAVVLGNVRVEPADVEAVSLALAHCAAPGRHRWLRRNSVEALGTVAQTLTNTDARAKVAATLTATLAGQGQDEGGEEEQGESEQEEEDQYGSEETVMTTAALSIARLADGWRCKSLSCAAPTLAAVLEEDANHRLAGTMRHYAAHALARVNGEAPHVL